MIRLTQDCLQGVVTLVAVIAISLAISVRPAASQSQGAGKPEAKQATPKEQARLEDILKRLARLEAREAKQAESSPDLRIYWKDGLRFDSADKAFRIMIGGRIMNDWAFMREDSAIRNTTAIGDLIDGTEFRRARLYMAGTIYKDIVFKVQYDFAGGDADFKDVFLGLQLTEVGLLKAGHFKEPFGLEQLTSSKYITFMERSLPDIFTPGRNTGLGLSNHAFDEHMTWAIGLFRETDGFGDTQEEGGFSVSARVTGLPWEDGADRFLHLGLSRRSVPNGIRSFSSRPESHLAPAFVNTGAIAADAEDRIDLELALVYESFSVQGEYMLSNLHRKSGSDPEFSGFYIMGSWFPFGGTRAYKRALGTFSRVKPKQNFSSSGEGCGALELAVRYSQLDLNDSGISGGKLDDISFGLNWYLNPNTRLMWNYVHADLGRVGDADMILMRFQLDF